MPIDGTLLSDEELYIEDRDFDRQAGIPRWEDADGVRWRNDRTMLFKPPMSWLPPMGLSWRTRPRRISTAVPNAGPGGADQVGRDHPGGRGRRLLLAGPIWPRMATCWRCLNRRVTHCGSVRSPTRTGTGAISPPASNTAKIMSTNRRAPQPPGFPHPHAAGLRRRQQRERVLRVRRVAVAFNKVIACDTGNRRLKVM